jgi:hypothetical protein
VMAEIIRPALAGMAQAGTPFKGVLFAGLMLTATGPQLIEFNARFGDPECQVLMLRLESDIVPYLMAAATGGLAQLPPPQWRKAAAICVVLAAKGYPESPEKGSVIQGADAHFGEGVAVFHAGTALREDGAAGHGRLHDAVGEGDNRVDDQLQRPVARRRGRPAKRIGAARIEQGATRIRARQKVQPLGDADGGFASAGLHRARIGVRIARAGLGPAGPRARLHGAESHAAFNREEGHRQAEAEPDQRGDEGLEE